MFENEVRSLFTLAGIDVLKLWKLENKYWGGGVRDVEYALIPRVYEEGKTLMSVAQLDFLNMAVPTLASPWWLVKTTHGLIEIGWRKRVINIDWEDTGVPVAATTDQTTQGPMMVHAWSLEKALEYLVALRKALDQARTADAVDPSEDSNTGNLTTRDKDLSS